MLVITDLMVFSLRPNCHVGNELLESVFISKFVSIYLKMAVFLVFVLFLFFFWTTMLTFRNEASLCTDVPPPSGKGGRLYTG